MVSPLRSAGWLAVIVASAIAPAFCVAQDSPKPQDKKAEAPPAPEVPPQVFPPSPPVLDLKDDIKPLPPVAIPDDPPPHEGAFFDLPITIEPPDILIVEVLEALPGRPITGERLVRPDGTISLGFYGDVYVRGLTIEQAKARIVIHLRKYMNDFVLGLLAEVGEVEGEVIMPDPEGKGGRKPFDLDQPGDKKPEPEAKPVEKKEAKPFARISRRPRPSRRIPVRIRSTAVQEPGKAERRDEPQGEKRPLPEANPNQDMVVVDVEPVEIKVVPPAESARVFVDIVAFNTHVYYVQGDVGVPGRLAWTGKETVLDALNYAGGFIPTGEPTDIHLYRPARGGKPAKDYKIDHEAILKGIATANFQVFPNDRLVVGRNPIVKKTVEVDRAASLLNSMSMSSARRDALVKEWADFLWSISGKEGGAMLDEKAFKDALMKKLAPAPDPK